jgi:hypothetical protein
MVLYTTSTVGALTVTVPRCFFLAALALFYTIVTLRVLTVLHRCSGPRHPVQYKRHY